MSIHTRITCFHKSANPFGQALCVGSPAQTAEGEDGLSKLDQPVFNDADEP